MQHFEAAQKKQGFVYDSFLAFSATKKTLCSKKQLCSEENETKKIRTFELWSYRLDSFESLPSMSKHKNLHLHKAHIKQSNKGFKGCGEKNKQTRKKMVLFSTSIWICQLYFIFRLLEKLAKKVKMKYFRTNIFVSKTFRTFCAKQNQK